MLRLIERLEMLIAATLVAAILALATLQVISRYILARPFTWTEELARFALIALTFVGAALVTGRAGHIVVDLNPDGRSVLRRWTGRLAQTLTILGAAYLALTAAVNAIALGTVGSSATGFPLAILSWIMGLGLALVALHGAVALVRSWADGEEAQAGVRGL